jgi:hypothetical protein
MQQATYRLPVRHRPDVLNVVPGVAGGRRRGDVLPHLPDALHEVQGQGGLLAVAGPDEHVVRDVYQAAALGLGQARQVPPRDEVVDGE